MAFKELNFCEVLQYSKASTMHLLMALLNYYMSKFHVHCKLLWEDKLSERVKKELLGL